MRRMSVSEFRKACPDTSGPGDPAAVSGIIAEVRKNGDAALREYTRRFDRVEIGTLAVGADEIAAAARRADPGLVAAMREAAENIRRFALCQMSALADFEVEIRPGVFAGQAVIPLARAGIYVPGGRYPLVSTLLMTAIPASTAGVREIVVCTPPGPDGAVPRAILAAAELCGGRMLLTHEGGYNTWTVPFFGLAVMEELSGIDTGTEDPFLHMHAGLGGQELQPHQGAAIAEAEKLLEKLPG